MEIIVGSMGSLLPESQQKTPKKTNGQSKVVNTKLVKLDNLIEGLQNYY